MASHFPSIPHPHLLGSNSKHDERLREPLPGHCDGGRPDDWYGGDHFTHVLRSLLLRPHDQPPPVQRDRHDGDRRDEDRGRLQQPDHSAAELQEQGRVILEG